MRKNLLLTSCLTFALALPLLPATASAADLWISDVLHISLREDKSAQAPVVNKALKSGTQLKVIEDDAASGWTLVATTQGDKGWVERKYLMNQPPAAARLVTVQNRVTLLEQQRKPLDEQLRKLLSENATLREEMGKVSADQSLLDTELNNIKENAAKFDELSQRHQALMQEHQMMQTELDVLKAENTRLRSSDHNTFLLYGAAAVGLGVLITLIVPALRRRKRYSDWA